MLRETPGLEAKTLFELLVEKYPGRYDEGQLRTLQRAITAWRAEQGPDKEVVLAQQHRPGEAAQTDFTRATELGVTIAGQVFVHLLCVFVLPYSNWQWATVCLSESMAALRKGVQRALFQLGRVPRYHQTDNSTAATHRIPDGKAASSSRAGKRPFNEEYLAMMRHFGMKPRTTEVGAKEQNGDVEAATARSSGGSSRRCWCAAAATSRASRRGRRSSTRSCARPTGRGPRVAEDIEAMRELERREAARVRRGGRAGQRVEHGARQALRVLGAVAAHRRGRARAHLRGPHRGVPLCQRK